MDPNIPAEALKALFDQLSERQTEVLRLLAAHRTAKEIARDLGISEYTVRAHATEARKRLTAGTLREALILLARYEAQATIVSNWQSQPDGMARDAADEAGWPHDKPGPHPSHSDHDPKDASAAEPEGVSPDAEAPAMELVSGGAAEQEGDHVPQGVPKIMEQDHFAQGVLLWVHARFKALTAPAWLILLGASTLLVLLMTVGVLAGAGAVLQSIQDLGVRAR